METGFTGIQNQMIPSLAPNEVWYPLGVLGLQ